MHEFFQVFVTHERHRQFDREVDKDRLAAPFVEARRQRLRRSATDTTAAAATRIRRLLSRREPRTAWAPDTRRDRS
jgi:hypothetical protein